MKIIFVTIVLDGMPYIAHHLPTFNRLPFPWEWRVVEGVAKPAKCTSWCKSIESRLSIDGTSEYLKEISVHPRVKVIQRAEWDGKVEMCNAATDGIYEDCIVMQVDYDELWTAGQLGTVRQIFAQHPEKNCALFDCRYFVGHNVLTTRRGTYGNRSGEWLRAFRWGPGMRWESHEPPRVSGMQMRPMDNDFTASMGLTFDHYAYATEKQARFKQEYYGYNGAVDAWRKLQANQKWPAKLRDFFPWVNDDCEVTSG